jgi:hypothetical protein
MYEFEVDVVTLGPDDAAIPTITTATLPASEVDKEDDQDPTKIPGTMVAATTQGDSSTGTAFPIFQSKLAQFLRWLRARLTTFYMLHLLYFTGCCLVFGAIVYGIEYNNADF